MIYVGNSFNRLQTLLLKKLMSRDIKRSSLRSNEQKGVILLKGESFVRVKEKERK